MIERGALPADIGLIVPTRSRIGRRLWKTDTPLAARLRHLRHHRLPLALARFGRVDGRLLGFVGSDH